MALLLSTTSCASVLRPPSLAASQPSSAPVVHRTDPWVWRDPPRFPSCTVVQAAESQWCLTVDDARRFLHWQQEQRSDTELSMADLAGQFRTEKARRELLDGGQGLSALGWLGVAAGVVAAAALGLALGWAWGHFGKLLSTGLEVPGAP